MALSNNIFIYVLLLTSVCACVQYPALRSSGSASSADDAQSNTLLPAEHKVLLILGQDLSSVRGYVDSGYFPTPAAITTYLSFYRLKRASFPAYGALGLDPEGRAVTAPVDWGAGPLNAYQSALSYPHSALVIGLNIAEGSGTNIWAEGGLADIGVGAYDENIRLLADFCKKINRPVYLRIGYEFDGAWNSGYANKTSYILAYRRIVDVMREQAVRNVAFVWQASASALDDAIDGGHENIQHWYPGDAYVDWLGLSWFLPADEIRQGLPSQRMLADEVITLARLKNKPVMIAEAAAQGYDLSRMTRANISPLWDGDAAQSRIAKTPQQVWQEWYQPFFEYIHANADVIRAVAYINAEWDAQPLWSAPYRQGYWGDSRVQLNPQIRQYWLDQILQPWFWQHGGADLMEQLLE